MKSFDTICAQGDVLILRVADIPRDARHVPSTDGKVIVTHSETGHHHCMVLDRQDDVEPSVEMFQSASNPLLAWIKVNRPTPLDHMRPHDTHESIMFRPGVYEVRRQREYTPEGWRKVTD